MGQIVSVNIAVPQPSVAKAVGMTGIDKQAVAAPVLIRVPEPQGSGVVGDRIFDTMHHGGEDQAVYAYAREDYDWWQRELGRPLRSGLFGDNLTTVGIDVNAAVIGERWRIGADLVLQATYGRIPCATFQARMDEPQWTRRFTAQARPGAYFRVMSPGRVAAGDAIVVMHRPAHGVTIAEAFRAWTLEPQLLPRLLEADEAPEDLKERARQRLERAVPPVPDGTGIRPKHRARQPGVVVSVDEHERPQPVALRRRMKAGITEKSDSAEAEGWGSG